MEIKLTNNGWSTISPYYWTSDGKLIYAFSKGGPTNQAANFWVVSSKNGNCYPLLDLKGSIMEPAHAITSDGKRLYFPLWECTGDIWMAELVEKEKN